MEKIKRMQSLIPWVAWAILIGNSTAHADSFTFDTLPASADVAGPAGSTVGWGYAITNSALNDWLLMTGLSAGSFLNGTPDSSLFDFPILVLFTIPILPRRQVSGLKETAPESPMAPFSQKSRVIERTQIPKAGGPLEDQEIKPVPMLRAFGMPGGNLPLVQLVHSVGTLLSPMLLLLATSQHGWRFDWQEVCSKVSSTGFTLDLECNPKSQLTSIGKIDAAPRGRRLV
jgi:hypothetical protein